MLTMTRLLALIFLLCVENVACFSVQSNLRFPVSASTLQLNARKTLLEERATFDPLQLAEHDPLLGYPLIRDNVASRSKQTRARDAPLASTAAASTALAFVTTDRDVAYALDGINLNSFKPGLTIENFQPVCGTSDGFYRILQQSVASIVGPENFSEYGPLIASGLLRVRLELCVVESFFNEAVGPFIRDNGLSWILPLHETVETFIAGCIFAIATTFILIGSTKLVTVILTYTDFLIGLPSRLFGGFAFDRAQGKPVTLDVGFGPFKTRLIGPPKDSEIDEIRLKDLSIVSVLVLLVSGTVNYFGQGLRVRTAHWRAYGSVCRTSNLTCVTPPCSSFESLWKHWMRLSAAIWQFGRVRI
jgi:hypothetical protein